MPIADHRPVKALTHTSAQTVLRLTRDEVRVLQYYRTLFVAGAASRAADIGLPAH